MPAITRAFCAVLSLAAALAVQPAAGEGTSVLETALRAHIAVLASDDYGGREPGTPGEAKTIAYIADQFRAAGLESGTNDPGHPWFAPVALVETRPFGSSVQFFRGSRAITLDDDTSFAVTSGRRGLVEKAQLLFVGHGDPAPSAADLAGRVAVLLDDRADGDAARDRQGALLRAGAAAVITILDGERTIEDVWAKRSRPGFVLGNDPSGGDLEAFITPTIARRLFAAVGADYAQLSYAASAPGFAPKVLPLTATIEATGKETDIASNNVIGKLPGKHPDTGALVFMAHWDGFGTCAEPPATDLICNGAIDNASGVATLIEVARALAKVKPLDRDVYFVATTGEEMGLLGAQSFTQSPPVPLDDIVAAFNFDSNALARKGDPLAIIGRGRTPLDPAILRVARDTRRKVASGDPGAPYLRRQDGWALIQHDLPAVSITSSFSDPARVEEFFHGDYHKPGDELKPSVQLAGTAEDVMFHVALAKMLGDAEKYRPERK